MKTTAKECVALIVFFLGMTVHQGKVIADDYMPLPPFEEMLGWSPLPDRTLVVSFEGIQYRFEILEWEPAPDCAAVSKVAETDELRWVTRAGWFAHEYFTRAEPVAIKRAGDPDWSWILKRTARICIQYDYEKLKCVKWRD